MANAFDVASYVLGKTGPTSAMKLQKLVYYSLAWHSVWSDAQLFSESVEAWAHGPVIPDLYQKHKGHFIVNAAMFGGDSDNLTDDEKDSIDKVLEAYGDKSSQWLSDLTHMEEPWRNARNGVPDGERCNNKITLDSIAEYYSAL